jgi:plasmid segregation protein ParM
MRTYAIGFDPGNSETCTVIVDGIDKASISIPSYTAIGDLELLHSLEYRLRKDDFVYRNGGLDTYVGGLAIRQSTIHSSGRGDSGRYWSDRALQLLLVSTSALIPDEEYALSVVTGLPVKVYLSSPDNRRRVKKALEGTHTFTINGKNTNTVHVTVERVIMECAGATIAYGLNKAKQGVVDIGGFTTDLFASNGQEPLTHLCNGIDMGVEMVGTTLSDMFRAKYGRDLQMDEVRDSLRKSISRKGKVDGVYANNTEVLDMREMIHLAVDTVGKQIASWIATVWSDSKRGDTASSFAKVLLIGGGSHYFFNHIKETIPNIQTVSNPEFANALGYAAMSDRALSKG